MIAPVHRDLVRTWVLAGEVPQDRATRQAAASLIASWMQDVDETVAALNAVIADLSERGTRPGGEPMGEPLPFPAAS